MVEYSIMVAMICAVSLVIVERLGLQTRGLLTFIW